MAAPFFRDIQWRLPATDKTAYLTFDDGPDPLATPQILDVLTQHDALATFFMLGRQVEKNPGLTGDVWNRGHGIGNHTWSHPDAWCTPFPDVAAELLQTEQVLFHTLGILPRLVRPPKGHFTAKLRQWCRQHNRKLVMWDSITGDFAPVIPPARLAAFAERYIRPGSVIVFHDNSGTAERTPEALRILLPRLRTAGWSLRPLPESRPETQSGRIAAGSLRLFTGDQQVA